MSIPNTSVYNKIQKDIDYVADNWILCKTDDPVKEKPGACIRMYMSMGQRQAMYYLRERWGCVNWKEFINRLLKEYEITVKTNGASR